MSSVIQEGVVTYFDKGVPNQGCNTQQSVKSSSVPRLSSDNLAWILVTVIAVGSLMGCALMMSAGGWPHCSLRRLYAGVSLVASAVFGSMIMIVIGMERRDRERKKASADFLNLPAEKFDRNALTIDTNQGVISGQ